MVPYHAVLCVPRLSPNVRQMRVLSSTSLLIISCSSYTSMRKPVPNVHLPGIRIIVSSQIDANTMFSLPLFTTHWTIRESLQAWNHERSLDHGKQSITTFTVQYLKTFFKYHSLFGFAQNGILEIVRWSMLFHCLVLFLPRQSRRVAPSIRCEGQDTSPMEKLENESCIARHTRLEIWLFLVFFLCTIYTIVFQKTYQRWPAPLSRQKRVK